VISRLVEYFGFAPFTQKGSLLLSQETH